MHAGHNFPYHKFFLTIMFKKGFWCEVLQAGCPCRCQLAVTRLASPFLHPTITPEGGGELLPSVSAIRLHHPTTVNQSERIDTASNVAGVYVYDHASSRLYNRSLVPRSSCVRPGAHRLAKKIS